jgi:hypothetical protein
MPGKCILMAELRSTEQRERSTVARKESTAGETNLASVRFLGETLAVSSILYAGFETMS